MKKLNTSRLKNQLKNLLEILEYFEDFRYDYDTEQKIECIEMYGEILIDDGVITDTFTDKNRRKLKKEWETLEMRASKLSSMFFPLHTQYFGADGKKKNTKEQPFHTTLKLTHYNKSQAAKALGTSRPTLNIWIKEKYLGLKTTKQGDKVVFTKRELARFHKLYSSNKN